MKDLLIKQFPYAEKLLSPTEIYIKKRVENGFQ